MTDYFDPAALLARMLVRGPDYDYPGYISKYGQPDQGVGVHLTDEFKLPSHATFSNDSRYSDGAAGDWVKDANGKWTFFASPQNTDNTLGASGLRQYFDKYEPTSQLNLPQTSWEEILIKALLK